MKAKTVLLIKSAAMVLSLIFFLALWSNTVSSDVTALSQVGSSGAEVRAIQERLKER